MSKSVMSKSSHTPAGSPSRKHAHFMSNRLGCNDFAFSQVIHHGFPYRPLCMAHDPSLGLLLVGTECGYLRVYGREYVDRCFRDPDHVSPVLFVAISAGRDEQGKQSIQALSICEPSQVSLWQLSEPQPCRMLSRVFVKERFSCAQLSQSHTLLFFGTEAGNVYILNARTLTLSDNVIHWNRAVGPSFCNHPGQVVLLNTSPVDLQRLFIGYSPAVDQPDSASIGLVVKWNLKRSTCEHVIKMHSGVTSMCWHFEGKSFACGHVDGSLSVWHTKSLEKPVKVDRPHGPISTNVAAQATPIRNVLIASSKSGELRTIFSGGIRLDASDRSRYLTVVRKRSTNVFQMDSPIVAMCLLFDEGSEAHMEPVALAILLEEDICFLDLKSEDLAFLNSPHSSQFGRQTITFIDYIVAPPGQFYSKLLKLHNCQNESLCSTEQSSSSNFPLTGGVPGQNIFPYNEVIVTGHANGSVCFWDCSAFNLSPMYTISAERYLYVNAACASTRSNSKSSASSSPCLADTENTQGEVERERSLDTADDSCSDSADLTGSPLAVESVRFHMIEPEHLIVVGAGGYVSLLRCNMHKSEPSEEMFDITVVELPVADPEKSSEHGASDQHLSKKINRTLVKVRIACRRLMGFHPFLVCLLPMTSPRDPPEINDVAFSEEHGLLLLLVGAQLFLIDTVMETLALSHDINALRVQTDPLVCATNLCQSPTNADRVSLSEYLDQAKVAQHSDEFAPAEAMIGEMEAEEGETSHEGVAETVDRTMGPSIHDGVEGEPFSCSAVPAGHTTTKSEDDVKQKGDTVKVTKKSPTDGQGHKYSRSSKSISEKLKRGSLFRKLSAHTMKIMQHVEKTIENEETTRDVDADTMDDQGLAMLLSRPFPTNSDLGTVSLTVWLATSASRAFALNLSVSGDETRVIKIAKAGDPVRYVGHVLLMSMIGVDSSNNAAVASENKDAKWLPDLQPFIVLASNNSVKVCCLPDRCCKFEQSLPSPIQAAWLPTMNGSLFLCTADLAAPMLRVYSIPRLSPLFQVGLPLTPNEFSCPLKKRLICSNFGMVCCLLNPLEMSKMAISSSIGKKAPEMQASLLSLPRNSSGSKEKSHSVRGKHEDPTRAGGYSFLRIFTSSESFNELSLFNAGSRKEPPGVLRQEARREDTLSATQAQGASSQVEASKMLQAGIERGQRLQQLDATTARMAEGAREFGKRAKQLSDLQKQRSEKWWQLWR